MTQREREAHRERKLDAAILIAWGIFILFVLLH